MSFYFIFSISILKEKQGHYVAVENTIHINRELLEAEELDSIPVNRYHPLNILAI